MPNCLPSANLSYNITIQYHPTPGTNTAHCLYGGWQKMVGSRTGNRGDKCKSEYRGKRVDRADTLSLKYIHICACVCEFINKGVRPSAVCLSPKKGPPQPQLPPIYSSNTTQLRLKSATSPRPHRDLTATSPRPVCTTTNEKMSK